jgi:two-component system sensor histidine kinase BaeS
MIRRLGCLAGCAILAPLAVLGAVVWALLGAAGVVGSVTALSVGAAVVLIMWAVAATAVILGLRRLAPPVGALVDAARRVEAGDYSARVPVHGPRQVRSLARAFNSMSERLGAEEVRRSSVLADIAHELRTPLTVIRSQAEAIADGVHPADEEHISPIVTATRTLEALADDLRTLTLVEAGGLRLNREPLDVGVLVNETADAFRAEAGFLGVLLSARVPEEPVVIDADPVRLRRVLGNLIANSLAHTHRGGSIGVTADSAGGGVEITVNDDGEGIPEELLPRVFDRFAKGPGSTGSGLGLAIVRDLVEAHGGSVRVESRSGHGATFRVTLPAAA